MKNLVQRTERMIRSYVAMEVLEIDSYSKLILANIIYKKYTHPNDNLDAIIQNVISKQKYETDQFEEIKGKVNIQKYWKAEAKLLAEKLNECKNLPRKHLYSEGDILKNTVIFYSNELNCLEKSEVAKEIMKLPISKEMKEVFITIVFLKNLYPDMSLDDCIKKIRLHIQIKKIK